MENLRFQDFPRKSLTLRAFDHSREICDFPAPKSAKSQTPAKTTPLPCPISVGNGMTANCRALTPLKDNNAVKSPVIPLPHFWALLKSAQKLVGAPLKGAPTLRVFLPGPKGLLRPTRKREESAPNLGPLRGSFENPPFSETPKVWNLLFAVLRRPQKVILRITFWVGGLGFTP